MLIRLMAPEAFRTRVPSTVLSVPSSLNQVGLSAIVSHLLGEEGANDVASESVRGFEFCVNAAFAAELLVSRGPAPDGPPPPRLLLRGSLRAYARNLGATGEVAFALDFARAVGPSAPGGIARMPDAVTALGAGGAGAVAVGLSNGYLLLARATTLSTTFGSASSDATAAFARSDRALHVGALTGVALADGTNGPLLATGGRDGAVRLWTVGGAASTAITVGDQVAELTGADGPVGRVAFDPSRATVAAGDGAGNVLVWSAEAAMVGVTVSGSKGGKRARGSNAAESALADRAPLISLAASAGTPQSAVAWCSSTTLAAGGMDSSVRVWDISAGGVTAPLVTLRAKKPVTALAASALGGLLASGHTDGSIMLWDSRGRAAADTPMLAVGGAGAHGLRATLRGPVSGAWVADVAWVPAPHLLLSADYSGAVSLWDVRAPAAPISTVARHEGKVFAAVCVGGATGLCVASGGEDATVRLANIPAI